MTNHGASLIQNHLFQEHINQQYAQGVTEGHLQALFIDSFCSGLFRQAIENPVQYKPTAVLSELMYSLGTGLIYPSILHYGAMNIAIRAADYDPRFEVFFTTLYEIQECFGYGINRARTVKYSTTFDADGKIHWTDAENGLLTQNLHQPGPNGIYGAAVGWHAPTD